MQRNDVPALGAASSADPELLATKTDPEATPRTWRRYSPKELLRSKLVRASATYVGSNVLNRAVPFLLLPVLTRYLDPSDYGIAAMFAVAVALTVPLVGLVTDAAVARRYFDRDEIDFPKYIANCFYVLLATGAVVAVLLALLSGPIASALAIPRGWVWAIILVAAGRYITNVVLNLWQVRQKPLAYAAYSFSLATVALGVAVLLIVGMGFGWEGRVIGEVASMLLLGAVGLVVLTKGGWLRHGFDRAYMVNALRYGTGLVPHLYGGVLLATTDRLFLTHMVGVDETGVYVVAVQIAMMIGILHHSFNQAWAPWHFGVLKRNVPAELEAVRRFTRFYNVAIVALAVGLAAVTPWLLGFLVGPEFRGAAQFVFWLALASAFEGMYKIVVNQIFWANKTHWLAWITVVTAAANVLCNYLLISAFGAVGAAQAAALTMFLTYMLTARLSARVSRTLAAAAQ